MRLQELEVKLHLHSHKHFQEVFDACTQLYGPSTSHVWQLDNYYDTSDGQLKKQDLVVRIREIDNTQTIALKSPRVQLPSGAHNRIELEFTAAAGQDLERQLSKQGLEVVYAAEKERWTFVSGEIEVAIDRLPFLGWFIEVEGPSEAAIEQVLLALHLSFQDAIRQNYAELMTAHVKKLGMPPAQFRATFAAEKALSCGCGHTGCKTR